MLEKIKSMFGYSKRKLARELQSALKAHGVSAPITYDQPNDCVLLGEHQSIYLGNIFHEVSGLKAGDRKKRIIALAEEFVRPNDPQTWEEVANFILPKVRTQWTMAIREFLLKDKTMLPKPGKDYLPICNDLALEFVIDGDAAMKSTNGKSFECWGVSIEDVKRQAMANLNRVSSQGFDSLEPGLWVSQWQDNYDDSRILLMDKILELKASGTIVAFIPNRDCLILVDSGNDIAMKAAIELVEKAADHPRHVTLQPYQITEAGIALYSPHPDAAWAHDIRLLHVRAKMLDHQEQKHHLEQHFQAIGEDVFVATFSAMQSDNGEVFSFCTWAETVPTYLPRTDYVALVQVTEGTTGKQLGMVKWEEIMLHCSDLLSRQSFYPDRYFVDAFPSAEILDRMTFDRKN